MAVPQDFFGAIACAQACAGASVVIVEKSREVLGKVKISGGGRCNVTHACFDPRELVEHYPRGSRQLIGPMNRFGPADTMSWFEDRGVPLKIEDDNRVFPTSDSSQSIIDCLTAAAREAGIDVRTATAIESVDGNFSAILSTGGTLRARNLLLTTGGTRNPAGASIAAAFGHEIQPAAPSLFTFKIDDPRIKELPGLSVAGAKVRLVDGSAPDARGPVLVTHWGLSGPGILRLSARGARELQQLGYRFEIEINWCCDLSTDAVREHFVSLRGESPRKLVHNHPQFGIPSRLWQSLVKAAVIPDDQRWPHLGKKSSLRLARELTACRFRVDGKSMNKEEFVTCGGVDLKGVDFRTMQSRHTAGLYFAGENPRHRRPHRRLQFSIRMDHRAHRRHRDRSCDRETLRTVERNRREGGLAVPAALCHNRAATMKLASVLWPLSPTNLKLAAQCGVEGVVTRYPGPELADLLAVKEKIEAEGLQLVAIEGYLPIENIKIGNDPDGVELAAMKRLIEQMGEAGIPVLCYNFMAGTDWVRTRVDAPERGGARVTAFDLAEVEQAVSLNHSAGKIAEEEISAGELWKNLARFLDELIPSAESAGVTLAMHPDDPPLPEFLGKARIMNSVENFSAAAGTAPEPAQCDLFLSGQFRHHERGHSRRDPDTG